MHPRGPHHMLTQALHQAGSTRHRATGVHIPKSGEVAPFNYSDGDVEAAIYQQLQGVKDLRCGSPELSALITDWPRQYHFAPQRADLLRPLSHLLRDRVACGSEFRRTAERPARATGDDRRSRRPQAPRE